MKNKYLSSFVLKNLDSLRDVYDLDKLALVGSDPRSPDSYQSIAESDHTGLIHFFFPPEFAKNLIDAMAGNTYESDLDLFFKRFIENPMGAWETCRGYLCKNIAITLFAQSTYKDNGELLPEDLDTYAEAKFTRRSDRIKSINQLLPDINQKSRDMGFPFLELKSLNDKSSAKRYDHDEVDLAMVLALITVAHSQPAGHNTTNTYLDYLYHLFDIIGLIEQSAVHGKGGLVTTHEFSLVASSAALPVWGTPPPSNEMNRQNRKVSHEYEPVEGLQFNQDTPNHSLGGKILGLSKENDHKENKP